MTNNTPPDPAVLWELIERVEAASPAMQYALLDEAWEALAQSSATFRRFACAHCVGFGTSAGKFAAALEANAFESAAVNLVPEGWYWRAGHGVLWPGWAHLNRKHPDHCDRGDEHSAHAETPALALCAASLRAHTSTMVENGNG